MRGRRIYSGLRTNLAERVWFTVRYGRHPSWPRLYRALNVRLMAPEAT